MKKILLTVCLAWAATIAVHAQEKGLYGGFGFFEFGYSQYNNAALNSALTATGYSSLSNGFVTTGGQGFAVINHFVVGGAGGSMGSQSFGRNNTNGTFNAGYGVFQLGYAFKAGKNGLLYPLLGIGAFTSNIQIENDLASGNLNNILAIPNQVVNLRSEAAMLDISLHYSFTIFGDKSGDGGGGTMLGISAGGFFCPAPSSFSNNQRELSVVPDYRPAGFYLRLKFGGGGYGR
jgi:hypothetical protein